MEWCRGNLQEVSLSIGPKQMAEDGDRHRTPTGIESMANDDVDDDNDEYYCY